MTFEERLGLTVEFTSSMHCSHLGRMHQEPEKEKPPEHQGRSNFTGETFFQVFVPAHRALRLKAPWRPPPGCWIPWYRNHS